MRLLAAGAIGVGAVLALMPAGGHDQLWCLYVSGRLLDGVRLYGPELFESNPPLILWLSALPVSLARLLHVEPSFLAKLCVCAAIAATAVMTRRVLRVVTPRFSLPTETVALFFAVAFLCVPARDFGQREHLLGLLVLPYLLLAGTTVPTGSTLPMGAGVIAGAGLCLKPQQVVVPVVVEAVLLLEAKSWRSLRRPEPWLILAICTGYVGVMHVVTPEYFTTVLPILRETYWAIGHLSLAQLIAESAELQTLLGAALVFFFVRRKRLRPPSRQISVSCLAAAVAADLAYLQQGTGWYYQQLPAITFSLAALLTLLIDTFARLTFAQWQGQGSRFVRPGLAGLAVLATALTLHFSGYPVTVDRAFAITTPDPALVRDLPPGTGIATLTTSVDEAIMPVARYHLFWAQRTNNLWWMPAILRSEGGDPHARNKLPLPELQRLTTLQRRNMAEDLQRWKPKLILVERCQDPAVRCQVIEDLSPNLLAWFRQDPAFRAAFTPYAQAQSDGRFDVYRRRE